MSIQFQSAGRFHMFLAKIFGKRLDYGEGYKVYAWRNKIYVFELPEDKKPNLRLL